MITRNKVKSDSDFHFYVNNGAWEGEFKDGQVSIDGSPPYYIEDVTYMSQGVPDDITGYNEIIMRVADEFNG